MIPKNGSYFKQGSFLIEITNTCSIDYFILICYIISKKKKETLALHFGKDTVDFFFKFLRDLEGMLDKKNWDLARLTWLNICRSIEKKQVSKNHFLYDCFNSEYCAFLNCYSFIQSFTTFTRCPNSECLINKSPLQNHSGFSLKYNYFKNYINYFKFLFKKKWRKNLSWF